ncbi:MAG TPA: hypothetical protein VMO47_12150 [Rhodothermales bacterium]|nr:hypothetical protein [Rhodothermales bacterium]
MRRVETMRATGLGDPTIQFNGRKSTVVRVESGGGRFQSEGVRLYGAD